MEKKLIPELRFPEFSGEWDRYTVKELFDFLKNYSYSRNQEGDGLYHHIHYGDIHSYFNGFVFEDTCIPSVTNSSEHIELQNNDLVVADASEDYFDLGKTILIHNKGDRKVIAGLHTFALRPSEMIVPIYFYYFTKTSYYKKHMFRVGTGTSVFGVNKGSFGKLVVPTPNQQEQEKIGSFFFKLDKKIDLQRSYVEKLKDKKKGLMQRIFSKEVRFKDENGEDYPNWEKIVLGEVSDVRDGTHDSPKYIGSEGNMFITSKNLLSNGKIDFEDVSYISDEDFNEINKRSKVEIGDILFGMIGTIGNPVLVLDGNFAIKNVALIKEKNDLLNKYLVYFLDSEYIDRQFYILNTGGSQKFIGLGIIRELIIPIPSLPEQEKIASVLSKFDKKIELEEKLLEKYEKMKKGLMQKMFI